MRVSREQAAENRERVVDVAAELFRAKGFDGVGVAELMQAAGLTHGGFYGSFDSKDALEVEASRRALDRAGDFVQNLATNSDDPLAAIVGFYLSPAHRDAVGEGCAIAALSQEAVRGTPELREVFDAAIRDYLDMLTPLLPGATEDARLKKSLATYATMVGALLVSRTVTDKSFSEAILRSAADSILAGR
jgi:TetR/AcrR family transcriptional repressor of nem operon